MRLYDDTIIQFSHHRFIASSHDRKKWKTGHATRSNSLRLLPFGPDRIGDAFARAPAFRLCLWHIFIQQIKIKDDT